MDSLIDSEGYFHGALIYISSAFKQILSSTSVKLPFVIPQQYQAYIMPDCFFVPVNIRAAHYRKLLDIISVFTVMA